jgi:8-oxo-dGTP pyrophosphatase MutT (NUDIX family)
MSIPTASFALVVCQHPETGKFLLVRETQGRGWWLPGGHVETGETHVFSFLSLVLSCSDLRFCFFPRFQEAAVRETQEEAGVAIKLEGILRFEFTPCGRYNRSRYGVSLE